MLYGASNGHMTNDVTWPQKVKVVTRYIWSQISRKHMKIGTWFQLSTNRKPIWESNRHVIHDVTWPWKVTQICLGPNISKTAGDSESVTMKGLYERLYGASNGHMTNDATWLRKVKVVIPIYLEPSVSKTLGIETWFQWSTNSKPHMGNRNVTWSIMSRDLERSRSWPQYV